MESAEWLVWEREWDREGGREWDREGEREWVSEREMKGERERVGKERGERCWVWKKWLDVWTESYERPPRFLLQIGHSRFNMLRMERERERGLMLLTHSFLLAIPQRGCEWSEVKFNWMSATSNPNDAYLSFCLFKIITFLFWTEEIQSIFCSS